MGSLEVSILAAARTETTRTTLRFFYGWWLLGFAWILYGFGAAPGYYSWSFFSPEIIDDLALTRGQTGAVFGLFTFMFNSIAPITGLAIARWGTRRVMVVGNLVTALGCWLLSDAGTLWECLIYFGLLVGAGIGLSTIVPCQALATSWFTKYRARAVATVLTAGGTVGVLVTWFDRVMVQEYSWRTGWQIIAVLSLALAVLAAATVRNRPSDLGQKPDGMLAEATDHRSTDAPVTAVSSDTWTLSPALRTPQFAVLCLCTVAFAIPWSVTTAHGRLHLEDLGLSTDVAAQILSVMILVSIAGRITGAAGDFLVPEKVLGFALLVEAAGMFGLLMATTETMAYVATILVAVGFGAAYISTAVVVAKFFGRIAFAQTLGAQYLISGIFNALSPAIAGWLFDSTGSYNIAFSTIGMMCVLGGILTFRLRVPQPPGPVNVPAATE